MPDLYSDGLHYDALLGDQLEDLGFYMGAAKAAKGPVLELACGTGRLAIPLALAAVPITGLDLSEAMLARGREKAAQAGAKLEWVQADIRHFELGKKFNLIFLPFNSMQHLHDRPSLESLFACVRKHLAPGGHFILDVHLPSLALLMRRPDEIYTVDSLGDAPDGTFVTGEEVDYDDAAQVYTIRWHYSSVDGNDPRVDELRLRMFFPQELDALVTYNGFEILDKYGDFKGSRFHDNCLKQVLVCGLK